MKSYTDIEQSKKLAEILPLESADMYYEPSSGFCTEPSEAKFGDIKCAHPRSIRCWSLAALLSVLPDTITSNDGIAFKLNIKKNIIEYSNPSLYLIYKSVKSDNLIDIAYEMVLKLHKLNFL